MTTSHSEDSRPYPVVEVRPEWTLDDEMRGGREKFWYEVPEDGQRWLFKYPRTGSGEHWAEKIAAELAHCLDVPHAVVELAEVHSVRGSTSRSFAREGQLLIHGNELLAMVMEYDVEKTHGQSDHSLANIFRVLKSIFAAESVRETVTRQFASYLVLDGLIGNTDRHHQNWGILAETTATGLRVSLAPTFDHASSLGRDISDEVRARRLREKTVPQYARRARGRVFWADSGRYGPNPLELVRRAASEHPELFREPIARAVARRSQFAKLVERVPDDWMSRLAKEFTEALLDYNATELERCLK